MKLKNVLLISLMIITIMLMTNIQVFAKSVVVNVDTLILREEPSTDSEVLKLLDDGQSLEYVDETGDWYQVKLGNTTGYVSKKYTKIVEGETEKEVEPTPTPTPTPSQEVETPTQEQPNEETNNEVKNEEVVPEKEMKLVKDANLYILPLINANIIQEVKNTSNVKVLSRTTGWAYVETDEAMGWLRRDVLGDSTIVSDDVDVTNKEENKANTETNETTETETNKETKKSEDVEITAKDMYVNYSSVNVRKGPGTNYDSIDGVVQNDKVKVIAENGDWYKVEVNGNTGYIAKRLLSDKQTEVTTRSSVDRNTNQEQEVINTPNNEIATENVSSSKGQQIVNFAKQYLGCKYVYGGAGPNTFDCSGFTMFVFKNFGVTLSHSATAQSKVGKHVDKKDLQPGDLVFFTDYETGVGIGHCGIYIGDGNFIHASSGEGYCVKISTLLSGSYLKRYETATRVI